MRRMLLASVGVAILAWTAPASAADIPGRPMHPVDAAYDWSGIYLGAHVGYGWSRWTVDTRVGGVLVATDSAKLSGALGGLQLGFNWQTGAMVYGLETDLTASGQKASNLVAGVTFSERIRWFGTTRLRAGFALDRWLVYATGGVAYTGLQSSAAVGGVSDTARTTKIGWTVGAGVEQAINRNWTWRLEYLYIDAAKITSTTGAITDTFRARNHVARIGLNYKL